MLAITHDDGVEEEYAKALHQAVSDMRKFLAKAEELDLELVAINFVRLMASDFAPSSDELKGLDLEYETQSEPLLAPFDRDLVSLHLPLDGQADEAHLYDAVWKTTASMERFRRLLDTAWYFQCEYGLSTHRALDQRH